MNKGIVVKISTITLLSFAVFFLILLKVDPEKANFIQLSLFYLSMFSFLWGIFFLIEFSIKKILKKVNELTFYQATLHGLLLAVLLVGLLMFQHLGYFNVTNVLILFVLVVISELVFSKA